MSSTIKTSAWFPAIAIAFTLQSSFAGPIPVPNLGEANSFAVLAGARVESTGATVISGNLGVNPGSTLTGFPPGTVKDGAVHLADPQSLKAQIDATTAAIALGSLAPNMNLTGKDLGGMTLEPGVYVFLSSSKLSGKLVLDGKNDPNAVFVIQVGGSFTTADFSSIELINAVRSSNVFFVVANSATLGSSVNFNANVMASNSVTLGRATKVEGKVVALTGAVTLDENQVTNVSTGVVPGPTPEPTPLPSPSPTPSTTKADPMVFSFSCDFYTPARKGQGGALSCQATGSICEDGTTTACSAATPVIPQQLKVTCSDSFLVDDAAATRTMNGDTLSLAAKPMEMNHATVDFRSFARRAETLGSQLSVTYADGIQRSISGSCVLR